MALRRFVLNTVGEAVEGPDLLGRRSTSRPGGYGLERPYLGAGEGELEIIKLGRAWNKTPLAPLASIRSYSMESTRCQI